MVASTVAAKNSILFKNAASLQKGNENLDFSFFPSFLFNLSTTIINSSSNYRFNF